MPFLKKLYWNLMSKYVLFLIMTIVLTVVYLGSLIFIINWYFQKYPDIQNAGMMAFEEVIYDDITNQLTIKPGLAPDETLEILKDGLVVFRQGTMTESKSKYTASELTGIINGITLFKDTDIMTELIPIESKSGHYYHLLIHKKKAGNLKINYGLKTARGGETPLIKEINQKLALAFVFFLMGIILIIILFSRITSKKIMKPLRELNQGLTEVEHGHYAHRIAYKGQKEFEDIATKFNYMAERLEISQDENRKMAESKKQLLLNISHDLRTPATTVLGYAQALESGLIEAPSEKEKYYGYIRTKAERITELIDSLFKYSRLESSIYDFHFEKTDINEWMRQFIISYYGEIEAKGFDLEVDIPSEPVWQWIDAIELKRSFSNIIENALKYNPPQTKLWVKVENAPEQTAIAIRDDGLGIPDEIRHTLFQSLVRGDNARASDGGLGLGMAISKKIVEMHGGSLTLLEDEATTFLITLPVNEVDKLSY